MRTVSVVIVPMVVQWSAQGGVDVAEQEAVARNIELQREFYGEPLGDRIRRLVVAYDCSQAVLSEALGVSPPMLSQLMSGRRAKIGTPAVLARLVMLERRALTSDVASGDPAALRAALEQVRDSRPTVHHASFPVDEGLAAGDAAFDALRTIAQPDELCAAAAVLAARFPALAGLLRRAAQAV